MLRHHLVRAVALSLAIAPVVQAAVTIDGSNTGDTYGPFKTIQTNNTGFGDSNLGSTTSANGSELNAAYGVVENGFLNLFIAGNLETNFNHLNIFIADGRAGQNTLNVANSGPSAFQNMNGSKFSPGFQCTYALGINGSSTQTFVNRYDMTQTLAPALSLGSFTPGTAGPSPLGGVNFSLNNSNAAGVAGGAPSAPTAGAPEAVTTGLELSIPLSQLGTPSNTDIKVLVLINGGGNSYLSNQFLPGLPTLAGNVGESGNPYQLTPGGSAKFDFSTNPLTASQYFTVNAPLVSSISTWALTGSGNWTPDGNWSPATSPNTDTATAMLGASITADSTVTLDAVKTVNQLKFDNAAFKYTVAGAAITLGGVDPFVTVLAGNHEITAPVVNGSTSLSGVEFNMLSNTSLKVSGTISGGATAVRKSGGGEVIFTNAANSLASGVIVEAGTLTITNNTAAGSAGVTVGSPDLEGVVAAFNLGTAGMNYSAPLVTMRDLGATSDKRVVSSTVAGNTTVSGDIAINGGISFNTVAGGTMTVSSVIQNGVATGDSLKYDIRANGGGHVILTNANIATGETFVDAGTLVIASGGSVSGTGLNVFTAGTADIKRIDGIAPNTKIYAQGKVLLPGNTAVGAATLNTATLVVDNGGLIKVQTSTTSASPLIVNAGSVEFIGSPSNGQIDLTNNQLITTNTPDVVRQQLAAGNLITTANGGLGYKDTGAGTTLVQFAVKGDANLDGKVNTVDFNDLAGNFNTGTTWVTGDFSYDGLVDSIDFGILVDNFGKTLPAASPTLGAVVPEPASLGLIALAIPLIARRRRIA